MHSCGLVLEETRYHIALVSQHGGFAFVDFVYSVILIYGY